MNGYIERHEDRLIAADLYYAVMHTVWIMRWLRKYTIVWGANGDVLCCGDTVDDLRKRINEIIDEFLSSLAAGTNIMCTALASAAKDSRLQKDRAVNITGDGLEVTWFPNDRLVVDSKLLRMTSTCMLGEQDDPARKLIDGVNSLVKLVDERRQDLLKLCDQAEAVLKTNMRIVKL